VEDLPSAAVLAEREARREPLTRAEIGVLLAYAKIVLFTDVVATDVPDDPHFEQDLNAYFPQRMAKKFASDIASHRLRREIITRVVVNDLVNRGGPSFVSRLQGDTGRSVRDIVRAFAVVREGFALPELYREIDALDNAIDGRLQLDLYAGVARLVLTATGWCLRNGDDASSLDEQIVALRNVRKVLEPRLAALLPGF